MDIRPGQLVLAKSDFEASEIPIDWADEQKLPKDQRKTLRHVRIRKNEILFVVDYPIKDIMFTQYGIVTPVTRWILTFLRGSALCFMVSVVGLEDYVESIDYSNV